MIRCLLFSLFAILIACCGLGVFVFFAYGLYWLFDNNHPVLGGIIIFLIIWLNVAITIYCDIKE